MTRAQEEFEELARHWGAELLHYAHGLSGNLADARDLVQAAFLKAWDGFREGHRPAHPRAWLYRIVHNAAIDLRRRKRPRLLSPGASEVGLLPAEAREIVDAVRSLPAPYGDAVLLHYLQDLSIAETAEVLRVPEGTAKSQIARGLDLLRSRLSRG
jgi:RNA polymerase sigma-70 factor (ECF subfamily)